MVHAHKKILAYWLAGALLLVLTFGLVLCAPVFGDVTGAGADGATPRAARKVAAARALKRAYEPPVTVVLRDGTRRRHRCLDEVARPDFVREVQISDGGFTDSDAAELKPFTQIESLILPGSSTLVWNPRIAPLSTITDTGLRQICKHRALITLTFGSSQVTDAGVASLCELANLRTLELRASNVTDVGVASLAGMHGLNSAFLDLPLMTDAGLAGLAPLPALCYLHLVGTAVTGTGLESFHDGCALRSIAANFTDDGIASLCRCGLPFTSVEIIGPGASPAAILSLANLPSLSRVVLHKTSLTADDVEAWRRKAGRSVRILNGYTDALNELVELCDGAQKLQLKSRAKAKSVRKGVVPSWAGGN